MTDITIALFVFSILTALVFLFFAPRHGLLTRWKRTTRRMQRVLIEDALKHLYDCEFKKIPCTVQSLAGSLVISTDEAAKLITRLADMGLLLMRNGDIKLTSDGRSYALRVIRVHRLWEKFLADETSVPETEWHASAEFQEHKLTPDKAEELAAKIGNPNFDPHGDPIPSPTGEMPPTKGFSILTMKSGEFAQITHIEDEPEAVFAQLVAQGLYVGMQVMMIEHSNERVRIAADGEEIILTPLFANNITVAPVAEEERITTPMHTLSSLRLGEKATVLGISKACRGQQRRRLMDLGVVPGTKISVEMTSATGDPTAYNIRGALVALRHQHAQQIFIQTN